ncbi:MAG: ABC transporter ATP-binding protein [Bacteroidaceae bacterium]|nr:ABC transporter ATP-binding protein [Bacteroidaceae bacterium]
MIRLENISKSFRTDEIETLALRGVNMEIHKGEFVAIMGPSGCGKTTLLNVIGLIDSPSEGKYFLDGNDVSKLCESDMTRLRRGSIGFVFQSFNLIDELTVEENVELPLKYLGISKKERRQRVHDLLRRLAISHRALHYPQQLSGGQQQRVAIARAVVSRPRLILADEPTGNLDSKNGKEVMELLKGLHADGNTIIMVTHSERDALYADRKINLFDGQVVQQQML